MGDANINTFRMSLITNHALMSSRLRPLGANPNSTGLSAVDAFIVITPVATPIEGNLQLVVIAGVQSRTVSSPGWTQEVIAISNGTCALFWKVATGSEPANYTFTFSGILSGVASYLEVSNCEVVNPFLFTDSDSQTAVTTITTGNYNVTMPCVVLTGLALSGSHVSTIDNSFILIGGGGAGKIGYRNYANPLSSAEVTTWTIGGTENASMILVIIKGRVIR